MASTRVDGLTLRRGGRDTAGLAEEGLLRRLAGEHTGTATPSPWGTCVTPGRVCLLLDGRRFHLGGDRRRAGAARR
jgi:hypothetical protein